MDRTKANEVTLQKVLDDILWNMQWVGCNPEKTHPLYKLLFGYHFVTVSLLVLLVTVHFLQNALTIKTCTSYVMYSTILIQVLGKTTPLYLKRSTFLKISKTLKEKFWTADTLEEFKEEFVSKLVFVNTIFRCYRMLLSTVMITFILFPAFYHELIIPIWLPFEESLLQTSLAHLLAVTIPEVLTLGVCGYFAVIHFDYLFGFLLNAVIMQFQLLQHALQNIKPNPNKDVIIHCVQYHKILLEFVEDVEALFKFPILIQINCDLLAMCVCAYLFTDSSHYTDTAKFMAYALANIFQMFMYCMASQMLQHESSLVSQAVYTSDWYRSYDKDLWNSAQLIMLRSNKECLLTIWLVKLDLQLFIQVVQLSFSMFTLLQNTNDRK